MTDVTDAVALTRALIRCPSVTPAEGGALDLLQGVLQPEGFRCARIPRGGVDNLFARWGEGRTLAFGGHTDVVPTGDPATWTHDPFSGALVEGTVWGRGATDMKSGVAAFAAAAVRLIRRAPPDGSVALLITGDEEGDARDGTRAILDWMAERGEGADVCIVGEPTSREALGDTLKIGRRGSITGRLTVEGRQGHTAYPERALNPLPTLARICARLATAEMDQGSDHFQPSTLALASIDVGNPANNVIPAAGRAVFNVRFNDLWTSGRVIAWAEGIVAEESGDCRATIDWKVSGESFLTPPRDFSRLLQDVVEARTGRRPGLTTGGGTSDARFIKDLCPVIELGLVGDTMHQVDERVPAADVEALSELYEAILARWFA